MKTTTTHTDLSPRKCLTCKTCNAMFPYGEPFFCGNGCAAKWAVKAVLQAEWEWCDRHSSWNDDGCDECKCEVALNRKCDSCGAPAPHNEFGTYQKHLLCDDCDEKVVGGTNKIRSTGVI